MEYLYAPWRSNYITSHPDSKACAFCIKKSADLDRERYIIKRYTHVFVMLNLYPYNAGHVMVVPFEHANSLNKLSQEARAELIEVTTLCEKIVTHELQAEGLNIGLNLGGNAAGGTIPEHLHLHVLPRFLGDTNFLPLLSNTKQISLDLTAVYEQLKAAFN